MKTSEKLRKIAKQLRKQAQRQKRIKSAHVMEGMSALKRFKRQLYPQEN